MGLATLRPSGQRHSRQGTILLVHDQQGCCVQVLKGAMVGGPDKNDVFLDDRDDYTHSEVGVEYNAGLTGALTGLLQLLP